jgi:hypothetical protein
VRGAAALDAVDQVRRAEGGGGRHDHRAELHHREHRLPQLDLVAEHEDDAVALGHAVRPQPRRYLVGAAHQLGEGEAKGVAILLDDVQPGRVAAPGP